MSDEEFKGMKVKRLKEIIAEGGEPASRARAHVRSTLDTLTAATVRSNLDIAAVRDLLNNSAIQSLQTVRALQETLSGGALKTVQDMMPLAKLITDISATSGMLAQVAESRRLIEALASAQARPTHWSLTFPSFEVPQFDAHPLSHARGGIAPEEPAAPERLAGVRERWRNPAARPLKRAGYRQSQ